MCTAGHCGCCIGVGCCLISVQNLLKVKHLVSARAARFSPACGLSPVACLFIYLFIYLLLQFVVPFSRWRTPKSFRFHLHLPSRLRHLYTVPSPQVVGLVSSRCFRFHLPSRLHFLSRFRHLYAIPFSQAVGVPHVVPGVR